METTTGQPSLSFIIATIEREKELQACIASIERAHESKPQIRIEILVVVQKAVHKKELQLRYPAITTVYYISKIGLSAARNFAIEKSQGDYLVFIDDDAAVKENFIDILSTKIAQYGRIKAFCGRLIDPAQNLPFTHLFRNNNIKRLRRFDYQYFMGSAHVLSREVLNKIGPYDERFGVGAIYYGSEETDIFFRLIMANEPVFYLPDLIFFHPISIVPPSYVYKYAYAVGAVLTKTCLQDKVHCLVYLLIVIKITICAAVRGLQSLLFKGKYKEKAARYHYSSLFSGTFAGIRDFIRNEGLL